MKQKADLFPEDFYSIFLCNIELLYIQQYG